MSFVLRKPITWSSLPHTFRVKKIGKIISVKGDNNEVYSLSR